MKRCVHYVGFRDERFITAFRAFGGPAFIHRVWDKRSQRDIADIDLVVFASGSHDQAFSQYNGGDLDEGT